MRRPTLNLLVDTVAFAGFVFLATTGVLMRYVLPPGSGQRTLVWGLDRHEWGAVHFWISAAFLAVLAFHLVLHWKWIVNAVRGRPREGSGLRVGLGAVGLVAVLALAFAPLVSPVDQTAGRDPASRGAAEHPDPGVVRGSMSLRDVETATGISATQLATDLGLPKDTDLNESLGKLSKRHAFRLDDLRRIVRERGKGG